MLMQIPAFFFPPRLTRGRAGAIFQNTTGRRWSLIHLSFTKAPEIYIVRVAKDIHGCGDINEILYILCYKITCGAYLTTFSQVH